MSTPIPCTEWYRTHDMILMLNDQDLAKGFCLTDAEWTDAKAVFRDAYAEINPTRVPYHGAVGRLVMMAHAIEFRRMHPGLCRGYPAWIDSATPQLMWMFGTVKKREAKDKMERFCDRLVRLGQVKPRLARETKMQHRVTDMEEVD